MTATRRRNPRTNQNRRPQGPPLQLLCLEDRIIPSTRTWTGLGANSSWLTHENWNPIFEFGAVHPSPGDDLVFPAGTGNRINSNNFVANTNFSSLTFTGRNYFITGNAISLSNGITSNIPASSLPDSDVRFGPALTLLNPQSFTANNTGHGVDLFGPVNLNGNALTVTGVGPTILTGPVSGAAGLSKTGTGTLRLQGGIANTYTGLTSVTGGTLELAKTGGATAIPTGNLRVGPGTARAIFSNQIANTAAITINAGGTFDLNGQTDTVGTVTVAGGTLRTNGGRLTAGNTTFSATSTLALNLAGATTSDRLIVNGTVAVGGALQLNPTSALAIGTTITLIDNDGTDPVTGTFAGLPDGATLFAGGQQFAICYTGGTGNDVVLTRSSGPPPRVSATQINGGAVQRSMVVTMTVTFNAIVTFANNDPAAAFALTRIGGGGLSYTTTVSNATGVTVVTLDNFTGAASSFGSLADGRYVLTALADRIGANGNHLDGDGNGNGCDDYVFADSGATTGNQLYRLFGDANGDRIVDNADFVLFRPTFLLSAGDPQFLDYFDANRDGILDNADFLAFRQRFLRGI